MRNSNRFGFFTKNDSSGLGRSFAAYVIPLFMLLVLFVGCKPTEANYRKAYEAAKSKREAAEREQMLPATGLQSDDGPQLRVIAGDSIYVSRGVFRGPKGEIPPAPWLLAVGTYKMHTNAEASVEALRAEGWKRALPMRDADDKWYAIAAGAPTLDSIRAVAADFRKKHPGYPYIGLPGSPVLISAF